MSSILVVEDDPAIRTTVEYALRRAGFEVRSAADGPTAVRMFDESGPDLVLLDIMLPGVDGFGVAEHIRRSDTETAIIMVSALDQDEDKVRGLDVGADDYITKPFSSDELLARIRANLRRVRTRGALAHETVLRTGDLIIDTKSFKISVRGVPVALRLKEFQLLLALAQNPGRLCTRQMIAERVWGYEHLATSRTIDVHVRRIRQAIESDSDYAYIHTVHGLGYRFEAVRKPETETS